MIDWIYGWQMEAKSIFSLNFNIFLFLFAVEVLIHGFNGKIVELFELLLRFEV